MANFPRPNTGGRTATARDADLLLVRLHLARPARHAAICIWISNHSRPTICKSASVTPQNTPKWCGGQRSAAVHLKRCRPLSPFRPEQSWPPSHKHAVLSLDPSPIQQLIPIPTVKASLRPHHVSTQHIPHNQQALIRSIPGWTRSVLLAPIPPPQDGYMHFEVASQLASLRTIL